MSGVLHRVVGREVGGALDIGIGEDQHRVLAAELERGGNQPPRGRFGDLPAGLGRPGEHDHVDVLDEGRPGLSAPGRDLQDVLRQPALAQPFGHQQRGERRDLRGLEDHGVARGQRRDAVAEGVRQRVVPRTDHADQAERPVAH